MILEECAKFITGQFQTYFPELYQLTHGNLIQFYKDSIAESQEAIQLYKQKLYEDTALWLQSPTPDLQDKLFYLHNCIRREEEMQHYYPLELNQLQKQFHLIKELQQSVDLITEVLSYKDSEREEFIRDIVYRIEIDTPSLYIQFRDPFKGKAVIVHVGVSWSHKAWDEGAFYGRHSTDKQTMETQRSMAYEFAKKYGCMITCEYEDAGVSARK